LSIVTIKLHVFHTETVP